MWSEVISIGIGVARESSYIPRPRVWTLLRRNPFCYSHSANPRLKGEKKVCGRVQTNVVKIDSWRQIVYKSRLELTHVTCVHIELLRLVALQVGVHVNPQPQRSLSTDTAKRNNDSTRELQPFLLLTYAQDGIAHGLRARTVSWEKSTY